MKAILFKDKRLTISADYPRPEPSPGEALLRVSMAGICATDLEISRGYMDFEGIPGHEFVGIVEDCPDKSLSGKRVSGEINIACGKCGYCLEGMKRHCPERSVLGILNKDGAFAEYITLPMENLHLVPHAVSDEEALFIEPVAAAFEILEQVPVSSLDAVCLIGDGRLGLLTAQVLAMTGCRVMVEGRHEEKLALLSSRGIETRMSTGVAPGQGEKFGIVVDCSGSPSGLERAMELVRPRGTIILKTTVAGERAFDFNGLVIDEITLLGSRCGPFEPAIKALERKAIHVLPLVNKVFSLDEGVEAFRYAEQKGVLKVLIKMA